MKPLKAITAIFAALLIALTTLFMYMVHTFNKSVDNAAGAVMLEGLREEVTVRRDDIGVPYIHARNEEDLFFATGYVTASDRLWQMTIMKMAMQGRLSEIIGIEGMKIDLFMRTLGVGGLIDATIRDLDSRSIRALESFSGGVNAYLASHPDLPAEFILTRYRPEEWRPRDSIYVFFMLALNLSYNFIEELDFLNIAARVGYDKAAYLFPVYPDEELPFSEAKKLSGIDNRELNAIAAGWNAVHEDLRKVLSMNLPASNNWALSGARTKSGKSMVCNDTHLALMIPNAWMMMHQKCPTYEAAGVTPAGIPLVALGFNGRVAWGATMVMADNQDIFIEKLRVIKGSTHYLYRGQWLPVTTRREAFKIKGGGAIFRDIKSTVHGPLLNDALTQLPLPPERPVQPLPAKTKYGIALSWALGNCAETFKGFVKLATSRSAAEARSALLGVELMYLNILYGDSGTIAWQVTGKYPQRKKGTGQLPSPGWDGEYDRTESLPVSGNPHSENPATGYIATANNRTVEKGHPLRLSSSWSAPERADRLHQALGSIRNAAPDDMVKLQFDHYSLMAKKVQDMLFKGESAQKLQNLLAVGNNEQNDRAREALAFLNPEKFNAVIDKDSAQAAVYEAFIHSIVREAFLDELGPEGSIPWESFKFESIMGYSGQQDHLIGRENSPFWDDVNTKQKETKWNIILRALHKAVLLCEDRMGSDRSKWRWGKLHTYHWKHDVTKQLPVFHCYFNRGPYPAHGDHSTLDVASYPMGGSFDVVLIPAMRMVVDFGLKEPAMLVAAPGQSGNPSGRHYDDMLEYWLKGINRPLPFGEEALTAQYRDRLVLRPERALPR